MSARERRAAAREAHALPRQSIRAKVDEKLVESTERAEPEERVDQIPEEDKVDLNSSAKGSKEDLRPDGINHEHAQELGAQPSSKTEGLQSIEEGAPTVPEARVTELEAHLAAVVEVAQREAEAVAQAKR